MTEVFAHAPAAVIAPVHAAQPAPEAVAPVHAAQPAPVPPAPAPVDPVVAAHASVMAAMTALATAGAALEAQINKPKTKPTVADVKAMLDQIAAS